MKKEKRCCDIASFISVFGAREHNLKNIDVSIPKNKLTVITGPSGSGKSSLALDILFAEGKRRYMESLSSYARQFLGVVQKPAVDRIDGLCPAIAIEQKTVSSNSRSTVGTITEIYDYLRVLFARVGVPHCPDCGCAIQAQSPDAITDCILDRYKNKLITIVAPIADQKKGEFVQELMKLFADGFYRFIIDGQPYKFGSIEDIRTIGLKKTYKHTIELLVDTLEVQDTERSRLHEAVERALLYANGSCRVVCDNSTNFYSSRRACLVCKQSMPELEPRFFSFNSPIGACEQCHGLGIIHEWPWSKNSHDSWKEQYPDFFGPKYATQKTCSVCGGKRLNRYALAVRFAHKTIDELCSRSIAQLIQFFSSTDLGSAQYEIAQSLIVEIRNRLQFLYDVGLSYLTLSRPAQTLAGGEGQRIRLATQIGSALSGVLYILDEPSIGLHQRDNDRLIKTLKALRDQGNTVVVVEHDIDTMRQADYLIDMGPAAGIHGGTIIATGTPTELAHHSSSLTGAYLSGKCSIMVPHTVRNSGRFLRLRYANKNNLKNLDVSFPLGVLCGVSGVSGSGKSTLIMQELVPALQRNLLSKSAAFNKNDNSDIQGTEHLDGLVVIDQSPIGRTPRSNPATYLGVFDEIRKLFAALPESNARGYSAGRFSFNVEGGRCFECRGDGSITVEMHFLPPVITTCRTCNGTRYNRETLEITYRGKTVADVLEMTALEAVQFFAAYASIAKRLKLLCEVGLDYLKLGQPSTTLSGGEAQRIKLVDELAKRGGKTLYVLDEPTTGLHSSDIEKLLAVLNRLVDKGNSVIVIEHNLDILKTVDYLIDLGPEGGDEGGTIVAQGSPYDVSRSEKSYTGAYLKKLLGNS